MSIKVTNKTDFKAVENKVRAAIGLYADTAAKKMEGEEIGSGAYWFLLNDPYDGTERRFRFFQHDGEWIKIGEDVLKTSIVLEAYDEL